jgi:PiT family inorganic phosphate transporter
MTTSHTDNKKPSWWFVTLPPAVALVLTPFVGIGYAALTAAVMFEFVNGFHDASNAVAPLVKSHTLSYRPALWFSTACTIAPVLFIRMMSAGVALTIGSSLFTAGTLTPAVTLAGVAGAYTWSLATWRTGFPSSSSHALMGGLAGAAMMSATTQGLPVFSQFLAPGWGMLGAYMIGTPIVAGMAGFGLSKLLPRLKKRTDTLLKPVEETHDHTNLHDLFKKVTLLEGLKEIWHAFCDKKKWPILGATAALNVAHSLNDAQKAMPIVQAGWNNQPMDMLKTISPWTQMVCYFFIAAGTLAGGGRITKKLVHDIGKQHNPKTGFITAGVAAASVAFATAFKAPVSTSLTVSGASIGAEAGHTKGNIQRKTVNKMIKIMIVTPIMGCMLSAATLPAVNALSAFNKAATHEQVKPEASKTPEQPVRKPQPVIHTQRHAYV